MMAATKIDEIRMHLMGALGSIKGAKAGLFHGGEITLEILEAMESDVLKALEFCGQEERSIRNDKRGQ